MILPIALVAIVGFALSFYAFLIDRRIAVDQTYKPACDLSDRVSCSKVALSEYNRIFSVSNTYVGMAFYGLIFVLALLNLGFPIFLLACASLGATFVLAYILYAKIGALCLICLGIYLVNIALFVLSLQYR